MQAQMSSTSDQPSRRYHFFILGLSRQPGNRPGEPESWRISLENSQTAERKGFTDLAELYGFLSAWLEGSGQVTARHDD
ncbi:MAG: hypothetical protein KDH08_00955 [Anaerolineae bacterium]|nr:hypothetical protein [Anaerolineae bacterium]MCB0227694.1 hypothetical protein [Anaerolineae bacterium]MCB0237214.1 hypothetical protein [Anaerolineae bacterium]